MTSINKLTDAENERLAILSEECGEIIQVIGKIQRHGYASYHPNNPDVINRRLLEREIGDLLANIDLMISRNDLNKTNINNSKDMKKINRPKYTHYQKYVREDFPNIDALDLDAY